jgi:hypothetical protein
MVIAVFFVVMATLNVLLFRVPDHVAGKGEKL